MYNYLRTFAREQIGEFFFQEYLPYLAVDSVQGVHVGFDPYWLQEWANHHWLKSLGWPPWEVLARAEPPSIFLSRWNIWWLRNRMNVRVDLNFRPPDWHIYCRSRGYPENADPMYVRILLYPGEYNRGGMFEQNRNRSLSLGQHPILIEERPPCVAISSVARLFPKGISRIFSRRFWKPQPLAPGHSIGPNRHSTGTVGGFVNCGNRNILITCAHVVGKQNSDTQTVIFHPAPGDSRRAAPIGSVVYHQISEPIKPELPCHSRTFSKAIALDLAAVELTQNIDFSPSLPDLGQVAYWAPLEKMSPSDHIIFVGRTSGLVEAKMGEHCVWRRYPAEGEIRCFRDLFEVEYRQAPYINFSLAQEGDSGSWICKRHNDSLIWYGMLVACDGIKGYGCYAEDIVNDLEKHFGSKITIGFQ